MGQLMRHARGTLLGLSLLAATAQAPATTDAVADVQALPTAPVSGVAQSSADTQAATPVGPSAAVPAAEAAPAPAVPVPPAQVPPPVVATAGSEWEALQRQAIAQLEAGRLDEAQAGGRQALALATQQAGADGVPAAHSLGVLAGVYQARGDILGAEALLRWSLAILEQAYGPEAPALLRPLRGLAGLYAQDAATLNSETGMQKAGPWLQRGMRIVDGAQASGSAQDADEMTEFAVFVHNVGDGEGFLRIMQVVLAIRERTLGPDHARVGDTLLSMAEWFAWSRQSERVAPLAVRVLAIHERAYGTTSPEFANTLAQLRTLNFKVGDRMLAEGYGRRALDIRERALGPSHPDVAEALRGLADIFEQSARPSMAQQYRERASRIAPLPPARQ